MKKKYLHEARGGTAFINALGADKIPVQAWIFMGKFGVQIIQICLFQLSLNFVTT